MIGQPSASAIRFITERWIRHLSWKYINVRQGEAKKECTPVLEILCVSLKILGCTALEQFGTFKSRH